MFANPTLVAHPSSTLKIPKIRASCEECGFSKVKCDRGQPECNRCVGFGVTCVYGISRKFGKPRRKRPQLDKNKGISYDGHAKSNTESCENQALAFEQSRDINNSAQLSSAPMIDILPKSSINPPSYIDQQNQLASSFLTPLSLDDWSQLDTWGADLEVPSLSTGYGLDQIPTSLSESANNFNASFDSPDSHSCPRGSYELFRDLICPSPFLHTPDSNSETVSARLDEVLHFNRDAINRLSRLLECSCAKSGHRIMVHASIVSRILIWYQQAAGWTGGSKGVGALLSTLASSSASSSSSLSEVTADTDTVRSATQVPPTGFAVSQVAISAGTFHIEDQNLQASIGIQLVLSELINATKLIELFASRDIGESVDHGVTSLYSSLGVWLQSEHSRTVRLLKARLRALDRSLVH